MSTHPPSETTLRVRDLGEFGLIARLQARIDARLAIRPGLELGIGDDAAVWRPPPGARQVITTDALVEQVHFSLSTTSWRDLGWKALAVNVSDLAAMGAVPRYVLVSLGLPADTRLGDLEALYDGMLDLAERFDLGLIGGDVVAAPVLMLTITAIGDARGELLRRDAGRPGDVLAVTGTLGASAGGLKLLARGGPVAGPERLLEAHLRPNPRVAEAAVLLEAGLRCGMDVSDGLLGDTQHLCERSLVGAIVEVEAIPVDPALRAEFGDATLALVIGGGEDYELLCSGTAEAVARAQAALEPLGTPLTVIGRLVARPPDGPLVELRDAAGRPLEPAELSWDHFRA